MSVSVATMRGLGRWIPEPTASQRDALAYIGYSAPRRVLPARPAPARPLSARRHRRPLQAAASGRVATGRRRQPPYPSSLASRSSREGGFRVGARNLARHPAQGGPRGRAREIHKVVRSTCDWKCRPHTAPGDDTPPLRPGDGATRQPPLLPPFVLSLGCTPRGRHRGVPDPQDCGSGRRTCRVPPGAALHAQGRSCPRKSGWRGGGPRGRSQWQSSAVRSEEGGGRLQSRIHIRYMLGEPAYPGVPPWSARRALR